MRLHALLYAVILAILATSPAFADPINITGGNAFVGSLALPSEPPFGFMLTGEQTSIGGVSFAQADSFIHSGELVHFGSTMNVSTTLSSGPFHQTVRGVTYSDVSLRGTLHFAADPVRFTQGVNFVTARFAMDGVISLFRTDPNSLNDLLATVPVIGSGVATIELIPAGDSFRTTGILYSFQPVSATPTPEPGTVALLGSGLVAVIAGLRRRRGDSDR